MTTIDLSQFSIGQIITAFFIVIVVAIFIIGVAPKVIDGIHMLMNFTTNIVTSRQKKQARYQQLDKNTKMINELDDRLNKMTQTLNGSNNEMFKSFNEIKDELQKLRQERLQDKLDTDRAFVLNFANQIKTHPDVKHSAKEYLNVIDRATKYHHIIDSHGLENGAFEEEFAFIKRDYRRRSDNGGLLIMSDDINNECEGDDIWLKK